MYQGEMNIPAGERKTMVEKPRPVGAQISISLETVDKAMAVAEAIRERVFGCCSRAENQEDRPIAGLLDAMELLNEKLTELTCVLAHLNDVM